MQIENWSIKFTKEKMREKKAKERKAYQRFIKMWDAKGEYRHFIKMWAKQFYNISCLITLVLFKDVV